MKVTSTDICSNNHESDLPMEDTTNSKSLIIAEMTNFAIVLIRCQILFLRLCGKVLDSLENKYEQDNSHLT